MNYMAVHSAASADTAGNMWLRPSYLTALNGTQYYFDSVAESVTSNANYTQWTYVINPDRMWSNGQPVTSADFVATYSPTYALNPTYDTEDLRAEITSVVAVNSSTVVFNLNKSDAAFPVELNGNNESPPVSSQWIQQGPSVTGFGMTDITDGPFYASNYTAGSNQLVMYRNPYFSPAPQICEFVYDFVPADSDIPPLLEANSVDLAQIDQSAASSLSSVSYLKFLQYPAIEELTLSWDLEVYPYNMTAFRQAIAYAVNQNDILSEAFGGLGYTAFNAEGTVPTQSVWYNPSQTTYSYNQSEALTLLHQIGFTGGANGAALKFPNGTSVTLTLWAANDQTGGVLAAQIVEQELSNIGITINLIVAAKSTMIGDSYSNVDNIDHEMMIETNEAQAPGVAYDDGLPGWTEGYINFLAEPTWLPLGAPENDYNGNLSILQSTTNPTQVKAAIDNIQALNAEYLPVFFLSFPNFVFAVSTTRFTNFGALSIQQAEENSVAYAEITPVGVSTSTSTSTTTSVSASTTSSVASASSITTSTSASSSTSSSISIGSSYLLVVGTVVIILIALSLGYLFSRRRIEPE